MLPLLTRLVCSRCRQLGPANWRRALASDSSRPPPQHQQQQQQQPLSISSSPWLRGGQEQGSRDGGGGGGGSRGQSSEDPGASALLYVSSATVFMLGVAYASVPLYRAYCRMTGTASNPLTARVEATERVRQMVPVPDHRLTVNFTADTNSRLAWNFKPQQSKVHLVPGETVLVFYTATNPTDAPVTGIATYTVNPYQAAQYFNKIQCFCFEEQRLNPHEEVDMPVFFYIDPEFVNDPRLRGVRQITLSYCFFEAKEGLKLPLPGYAAA